MRFIRTERLNSSLGFLGWLTALISMRSWGTQTWKIVAQSSFQHTENLKIEIYHEFMTIGQSNIQSSNHRLSSIEKNHMPDWSPLQIAACPCPQRCTCGVELQAGRRPLVPSRAPHLAVAAHSLLARHAWHCLPARPLPTRARVCDPASS